jgi:hypothetical protein
MKNVPRIAGKKLKYLASKFPAVAITGPRQSGKTTLAKMVFPAKPYISLENPDIKRLAEDDPRRFLDRFPDGAILDEVQRAPHLFSYLQQILDESKKNGLYILTGSNQFLLQENISQTLAGRIAYIELLPYSFQELQSASKKKLTLENVLFTGAYPAIYTRRMKPQDWFPNYIRTYIDRDVRLLKNISKLSVFTKFIRLCAARTGQLLNMNNLAIETGVDNKTIQAWISILESSYLIHFLRPYHKNFNKRLVKMPKLYFYDTGLACALIEIPDAKALSLHPIRGALFENLVINELLKHRFNNGLRSNLYFWRDNKGKEIDVVMDTGLKAQAIEIKAGTTLQDEFFSNLAYWQRLTGTKKGILVYGGKETYQYKNFSVQSWQDLEIT